MLLKSSFTGCIYKHGRPNQWLKVPILEASASDVRKFTFSLGKYIFLKTVQPHYTKPVIVDQVDFASPKKFSSEPTFCLFKKKIKYRSCSFQLSGTQTGFTCLLETNNRPSAYKRESLIFQYVGLLPLDTKSRCLFVFQIPTNLANTNLSENTPDYR